MGRPAYLILHGYQGSGPGHWQSWLAGRLRSADAIVRFPDLPDADEPHPQLWLEAFQRELDAVTQAPVGVCHSLARLLWMHHVARQGQPPARLLLVPPPSQAGAREVLQSFFPGPAVTLDDARLVCSDNDPFCPEGAANVYAGLPT